MVPKIVNNRWDFGRERSHYACEESGGKRIKYGIILTRSSLIDHLIKLLFIFHFAGLRWIISVVRVVMDSWGLR